MQDPNCSVCLSGLLCQENQSCLDEPETLHGCDEQCRFQSENDIDHSQLTDDTYIEFLVSNETNLESQSHICTSDDCFTKNWSDSVQWILKMRGHFDFGFHTAYLSVTYLYRFLLRREFDSRKTWAIRLLSMACLSLAVKMEECKIPALLDYVVADYNFESRVIQRMELLVLSTLEWRMRSVTPFAYLNYLSTKLSNGSSPKALLYKSVRLILQTTEVMDLMNYRPSVIAAAAVLVSFDRSLTKESIDLNTLLISSCWRLEIDHVFTCYNLMLELEERKMKAPIISSDLSSPYASPGHLCDSLLLTSVSSKRRRLSLDDCDGDAVSTSEQRQTP